MNKIKEIGMILLLFALDLIFILKHFQSFNAEKIKLTKVLQNIIFKVDSFRNFQS